MALLAKTTIFEGWTFESFWYPFWRCLGLIWGGQVAPNGPQWLPDSSHKAPKWFPNTQKTPKDLPNGAQMPPNDPQRPPNSSKWFPNSLPAGQNKGQMATKWPPMAPRQSPQGPKQFETFQRAP